MSNKGIILDGNKAIEQIIDNKFEIVFFILFIFVLGLIGIFIYVRFIKKIVDKHNIEITKVKTKLDKSIKIGGQHQKSGRDSIMNSEIKK